MKYRYYPLIIIIFCNFSSFTGKRVLPPAQADEFKTVTIGDQIWMAENLDVVTFRNGDTIKQLKTWMWNSQGSGWSDQFNRPGWVWYDQSSSHGSVFGRMYNGVAVKDPRGLAPQGWHIPTKEEWEKLITFLGGEKSVETWKKLKSTLGWKGKNGNGTNESGFNALPGGGAFQLKGYPFRKENFSGIGQQGVWWTQTTSIENGKFGPRAWCVAITYEDSVKGFYGYPGKFYDDEIYSCFYIRCIKDHD